MRGIHDEARRWNVPVVGGDTKLGDSRSLLAVAIGHADDERELFLKNGAKPDDDVWVSGPIGGCNAATLLLCDGLVEGHYADWGRQAILSPQLPLEKSKALAARRIATGGTDISDGLGAALDSLCRSSEVSVVVSAATIPLAEEVKAVATELGVPPWSLVFPSGGDAQFLVTVPKSHFSVMHKLGFVKIGVVKPLDFSVLVLDDDREIELPVAGHRDRRGLSFADEIRTLVDEISRRVQK
jgi:thiamine-monophosphate kinase